MDFAALAIEYLLARRADDLESAIELAGMAEQALASRISPDLLAQKAAESGDWSGASEF